MRVKQINVYSKIFLDKTEIVYHALEIKLQIINATRVLHKQINVLLIGNYNYRQNVLERSYPMVQLLHLLILENN